VHVNRSLDRPRTSCARVLGYFNERKRGRARAIDYTARLAAEINNPLYILPSSLPALPRCKRRRHGSCSIGVNRRMFQRVFVFALDLAIKWTDWFILQSLIIIH